MQREAAPDWTRQYVGKPYQPPYGCLLLVADVLREQFKVKCIPPIVETLPSETYNSNRARAAAITEALSKYTVPAVGPARCGGMLVIINVGGKPCHIGILASENWLLHSIEGTDAIIEPLDSVRIRNRIGGFFKVVAV